MNTQKKTLMRTVLLVIMTAVFATVAVFATEGDAEVTSRFYMSIWSLLPPVIAIALALITKEVYSSLFIGILAGGMLYANFSFTGTIEHVFVNGIMGDSVLADPWNIGILLFLVLFATMVSLMNKIGRAHV